LGSIESSAIVARFQRFHEDNPQVYERLVALAREWAKRRPGRQSIAMFAWFAGRRQDRDHQHEVAKELRKALDQAAAALSRSRRTNLWVLRLWRKNVPAADPRVSEANAEQREAVEAARFAGYRLAVRLGREHPTVAEYMRAQELLDEIVGIVQDHAGRDPIDPFVPQIN
jgi:hypothetical protein